MEAKTDMGANPIKKHKVLFNNKKKQQAFLFLLAAPFLIQVIIFNYVPLWGWLMAFVDYSPGVKIFQSQFVGLRQFEAIFSGGSEFLMVMRNTLVLGFLSLLVIPFSVLLSILITECRGTFFKKFVQTATSLPNFISWVIAYSIFFNFLSLEDGFINVILLKLNIVGAPIEFLTSEKLVWPIQTFITLWKGVGWSAIIFISAIAGIDQELYQAAYVDGAGRFKRIMNITVPGIMPTLVVIMLLSVGSILSSGFEQYYMFHNGMVHNYIEILDTYTYRLGIAQGDYSFATAVGIFKTVVSVLLLVFVNGLAKKSTGQSVL